MNLKLRSYYGNQQFQIAWPAFLGILILFLGNIWFYIFHLQYFGFMQSIVDSTNGYITIGIIYNLYSVVIFYWLFHRFRTPGSGLPLFRNNAVSAVLILLISAAAFFIVSPFYEKEDLLLVPAGVDYADLFLCAVFEEIFFRYFILGIFFHLFHGRPVLKRLWLSVFATAGVFTIAHLFSTYQNGTINLFNYVSLLVFSIGISWIYIKYSNIILVIYVHFIGNFILNYLPLKSPGYSAGFLFLIFVLVLLAGRGNRIRKELRRFIGGRREAIRARMKMSKCQPGMPR